VGKQVVGYVLLDSRYFDGSTDAETLKMRVI
jgi:hypothetical protein